MTDTPKAPPTTAPATDTAVKPPLLDINGEPMHWLVRPMTIKLLWLGGLAMLAFVTWLGTTIYTYDKFTLEGTIGFYSWYGFVTCVAMVVFAKLLGLGLSKKDTYYDK